MYTCSWWGCESSSFNTNIGWRVKVDEFIGEQGKNKFSLKVSAKCNFNGKEAKCEVDVFSCKSLTTKLFKDI